MKINTRIDHQKNIRYHTILGEFDFSELTEYLEEKGKSHPEELAMDISWDLTQVDLTNVKAESVRFFANALIKILESRKAKKLALIVSSDYDFGMARMLENLVDDDLNTSFQIFRNGAEASLWLEQKKR